MKTFGREHFFFISFHCIARSSSSPVWSRTNSYALTPVVIRGWDGSTFYRTSFACNGRVIAAATIIPGCLQTICLAFSAGKLPSRSSAKWVPLW